MSWWGRSAGQETGRRVTLSLSFLLIHTETPSHSPRKDGQPIQEDPRAEIYKHYHKEAEEYDKEFIKRQ